MPAIRVRFTAVDDEGDALSCYELFRFCYDGKSCLVYTGGRTDEEGQTMVFASAFDLKGLADLGDVGHMAHPLTVLGDSDYALVELAIDAFQDMVRDDEQRRADA